MSTAAVFLIVPVLAAVGGSLMLYFGHRVRQSEPPDFQEQLRAIAPKNANRTAEQPSGIVHLDSVPDEEH